MQIIYLAILTIFASGIGTLTGFGSSTVMIPVLLIFFPLPITLLFAGILHFFNDIWKITLFRQGVRWKLILGFGIPGIIFSIIGASLAINAPEELLSRVLGAFLVGYVIFLLLKPKFKIKQSDALAITGGSLSGFLAGIFGIGGAVRSAFLSAFDLPKSVYIATAGAIALAVDSTRIITYYAGGIRLESTLLWGLLIFIPASFIGAKIAQKIVNKIPQKYFRIIIAVFLFIFGIKLVLFP
jgi:uncharacterized membrane protein YfcA